MVHRRSRDRTWIPALMPAVPVHPSGTDTVRPVQRDAGRAGNDEHDGPLRASDAASCDCVRRGPRTRSPHRQRKGAGSSRALGAWSAMLGDGAKGSREHHPTRNDAESEKEKWKADGLGVRSADAHRRASGGDVPPHDAGGDGAAARRWMIAPHELLGGASPLAHAGTEIGGRGTWSSSSAEFATARSASDHGVAPGGAGVRENRRGNGPTAPIRRALEPPGAAVYLGSSLTAGRASNLDFRRAENLPDARVHSARTVGDATSGRTWCTRTIGRSPACSARPHKTSRSLARPAEPPVAWSAGGRRRDQFHRQSGTLRISRNRCGTCLRLQLRQEACGSGAVTPGMGAPTRRSGRNRGIMHVGAFSEQAPRPGFRSGRTPVGRTHRSCARWMSSRAFG